MQNLIFDPSVGYVILKDNDDYQINFRLGQEQNIFSVTSLDDTEIYSGVWVQISNGNDMGEGNNVIETAENRYSIKMNMLLPFVHLVVRGINPDKPVALHCKRLG